MTRSWSFSFDSLGTPGHLRRSANGPASISWHNFQRLRWLASSVEAVLFSNVHSMFTASARGCSEETLFISFSKDVTGILRDRTCLEKDTNECSCLICDSSCCRTSCVSVQPCPPKVLPNTETFLHSRVFFVACVVPATLSDNVLAVGLFWLTSSSYIIRDWGLISLWYQSCDGCGFEFVRTNYVQHQTALQVPIHTGCWSIWLNKADKIVHGACLWMLVYLFIFLLICHDFFSKLRLISMFWFPSISLLQNKVPRL